MTADLKNEAQKALDAYDKYESHRDALQFAAAIESLRKAVELQAPAEAHGDERAVFEAWYEGKPAQHMPACWNAWVARAALARAKPQPKHTAEPVACRYRRWILEGGEKQGKTPWYYCTQDPRPLKNESCAPLADFEWMYVAPTPSPAPAPDDKALTQALEERDAASDYIDALLDEVLGKDRHEWTSNYGHADAMAEVRERMATVEGLEKAVAAGFPVVARWTKNAKDGAPRARVWVQFEDGGPEVEFTSDLQAPAVGAEPVRYPHPDEDDPVTLWKEIRRLRAAMSQAKCDCTAYCGQYVLHGSCRAHPAPVTISHVPVQNTEGQP